MSEHNTRGAEQVTPASSSKTEETKGSRVRAHTRRTIDDTSKPGKQTEKTVPSEYIQRKRQIVKAVDSLRAGFVITLSTGPTPIEQVIERFSFNGDDASDDANPVSLGEKLAQLRNQLADEIIASRVSVEGRTEGDWQSLLSEMIRQAFEIGEDTSEYTWKIENARSLFLLDLLEAEVRRVKPLDSRDASDRAVTQAFKKHMLALITARHHALDVQLSVEGMVSSQSSEPQSAATVHVERMAMPPVAERTIGLEAETEIGVGWMFRDSGTGGGLYRITGRAADGQVTGELVTQNANYEGSITVGAETLQTDTTRFHFVPITEARHIEQNLGLVRMFSESRIEIDTASAEIFLGTLVENTRTFLQSLNGWTDDVLRQKDTLREIVKVYIGETLKEIEMTNENHQSRILDSILERLSEK